MGQVINLRLARKARARAEASKAAGANRAAFGRNNAERDKADIDGSRASRHLDGHRLAVSTTGDGIPPGDE